MKELSLKIRDIPDFPKPGIIFKDITPLLADAASFHQLISVFSDRYASRGITKIVGIESRGFILAAALAHSLRAGLVLVRKPGKLPFRTEKMEYALEYGKDCLEIHADALSRGDRVLVVDDVLATGGTAWATGELVRKLGAEVLEYAFLMELMFLKGAERLKPTSIFSVLPIS